MHLIPDSQKTDILRAIVAYPESTIKETQKIVQRAGHQTCAPDHIKHLMEKEGITRSRIRGCRNGYVIPKKVIDAVNALNARLPSVETTKFDRINTPEMKVGKYPGNCRVVSL